MDWSGTGDDRLRAVFDRLIPADEYPAVSDAGLFEHLQGLAHDPATANLVDRAVAIVDAMLPRTDDTDRAVDLAPEHIDRAIDALTWDDRARLIRLAAEAYYGSADGAGARMVGYDRGATQPQPRYEQPLRTTSFDDLDAGYDVIVVGAGAGGGVAALVTAEAGARVLIVDRGDTYTTAELSRDHLRNHRAPVYGINTGPPPGTPRVLADAHDNERNIDQPYLVRWHNNAMAVGGGTLVYAGVAWRFQPTDFLMASTYGVPDGSSLADWPITYDDLEPHYMWAEQVIGVSGDAAGHPAAGPRSGPYPMAPHPPSTEARLLAAGAKALGLNTGPVPLTINTTERDGRGACVRCGECVGFSCPTNARGGSHNTTISKALATGNAILATRTRGLRVTTGTNGVVTGVELLDERTGLRRRVSAGHVVVACGAIESARLLLASQNPDHPDGLGNDTGQVGRHLQGHGFVSTFGLFDDIVVDMAGPGISIGTLDLTHGLPVEPDGPPIIGGGVVTNELLKQPIVHWRWSMPHDAPRWGPAGKAAMRESYRRTSHLFGHVQEIPTADHRVALASKADQFGEPVAKLTGTTHPETVRAGDAMLEVMSRWMQASGANRIWTERVRTWLLAGQHQAGTCRMGTDPTTSVTGPDGRVHGHANLWVADASVHVTNGSVNPALTIAALAHRTAQNLVRLKVD